MIRQFRMVGQDNGIEINLNDFNKYLLTAPTGLGLKYNNSYIKLGSQRIRVSQERDYQAFTGTIEVTGNTRDEWERNYNYLRDFVAANLKSGIKLYYKNTNDSERYLPCDIRIVSKTEKSSYAILVGVEFEPKDLWKTDVEVSTSVTTEEVKRNTVAFMRDNNFAENDEFSHNYGFMYEEALGQWDIYYMPPETGSATLINSADVEIPLMITIYGECIDPHIGLFDVNGNEIQSCQIYATLYEGDRVVLNSNPAELGIVMVRANGNTNVITTSVDTSLNSFLTLPVGEYTLRITESENRRVSGGIRYSLSYVGG